MASTEVSTIARFAFLSRLLVIAVQFVANLVIPDHGADAFNPPVTDAERFTLADKIIFLALGGFRRWDAIYFVHIAQHGYTYENCVAFFPLYPLLISVVKGIPALCPFLSESSLLLLFGVVVNVILFVAAAVVLLWLGQEITQDSELAYNAAVLFCINPASIFMIAPYTETLFSFLSFGGMLCVRQQKLLAGSVLIGLSALTRSNGLVSMGFVFHCLAVEYIQHLRTAYMVHGNRVTRFAASVVYDTTTIALRTVLLLSMALIPFACFQGYIYECFCFPEDQVGAKKSLDDSLIEYGRKEELTLAGEGPVSPWCFDAVPLSYGYIQSQHWGVGFMAYYTVKQIPNFILATPIITLSLCACYSFYRHQPSACRVLGLVQTEKVKVETVGSSVTEEQCGWYNTCLVVYILHLLFLTLFGCVFMHIQVLTRFLCSASPVIYWFAAYLVESSSAGPPLNGLERQSAPDLLALYRTCTSQGRCVLAFFVGYSVIGTVVFSNFLPWT